MMSRNFLTIQKLSTIFYSQTWFPRPRSSLQVDSLNLLKLAPGGHVGRFIIWTEAAFKKLGEMALFISPKRFSFVTMFYLIWSVFLTLVKQTSTQSLCRLTAR